MSRLYKKGEIAEHPCGGWSLPILDPEGIEITTIEYVCLPNAVRFGKHVEHSLNDRADELLSHLNRE